MKFHLRILTLVWQTGMLLSLPLVLSCSNAGGEGNANNKTLSEEFKQYWYQGEAELTSYRLEQARYGQMHEGTAVLIFVTEDFLTDKQVKYEFGEGEQVASVLKLNMTRKFNTGIYPYSMMSSVFTPVNRGLPSLKLTTSSQEWCGHTFTQFNYRNGQYNGKLFSYFQSEGDQEIFLEGVMLEDEIWNRIRLNPGDLPVGEIRLIPGSQFQRFSHLEFKVEEAVASLQSSLSDQTLQVYQIEYKELKRKLKITFEKSFPHAIVAWEEQMESGFGEPELLTTRAVRMNSINSPYWSQNTPADSVMREKLGL